LAINIQSIHDARSEKYQVTSSSRKEFFIATVSKFGIVM